jgi:creatinine amidohydrolase
MKELQRSMEAREMYFANLSWPEIEARLKAKYQTVLLFPVGATEAHGPHSPLGTDSIISLGMCHRAVRELEDDPEVRALILPPLAYGVTRYAGGFPGTIHISEATLQALIIDVCTSLSRMGFPYIILVNNHFEPEHVQTLHGSIDALIAETGVQVGYVDLTRRERAQALTEEFKKAECHAGRYETSLVLAERPELVDEAVMQTLPYVPVSLVQQIGQGIKEFRQMGLNLAYNGAPAEASAAEGEMIYGILTNMLVTAARELVHGRDGRDLPGFYNRVALNPK